MSQLPANPPPTDKHRAATAPRPAPPTPAAPPQRASDQDRDRTAAALAEALATGRLTPDEHVERLELTYLSRTLADLAPITADLPDTLPDGPVEPPAEDTPVEALFSKVRRGGAWPVPPRSRVLSRFGAVVIDLRQAVFTRREVAIRADSFCGKIEILVPENAEIHDTGTAAFGKRATVGSGPASGYAGDGAEPGPVIHISGHSLLGHVRVVRGGHVWPWRDLR